MSARRKWLFLGATAALLTSAAATAPTVLRRFDSFAVERVEITGTKHLAPFDAFAQSGITSKSNVFDDFEPWRARLLDHPMIVDATIERRLPGTVRVDIAEAEPIALARTPELRPVDARGQALPIDPANADLDVPLLTLESRPAANGVFTDTPTRRVITVLATLYRRDARLFSWISEAGPHRDHGVRLALRSPAGAEVLLPASPRALRLRQLHVALADLAARGELARLERIDARFRDQIVVVVGTEPAALNAAPDSGASPPKTGRPSASINGN